MLPVVDSLLRKVVTAPLLSLGFFASIAALATSCTQESASEPSPTQDEALAA